MPYTILLVDDDKAFRKEFIDYFDDFAVVEASAGKEALDILEKPNEIDLVLLDVMMPGMKGTDVLKKMRKKYPDLCIIIQTGYGSKDVAVEALKSHADDFIEKPVHIEKTKQLILDMLRERGEKGSIQTTDIHGKIERVKHFAERNYHKKVSLEEAAEIVCLSPKYLSRVFRQITGIGFSEYKIKVKVEKAKDILLETRQSIEQIAYGLGYQNLESFIRIFKKYAGCTPTDYRIEKG